MRKLDAATCGVLTLHMQGGDTELGHFLPLDDRGLSSSISTNRVSIVQPP